MTSQPPPGASKDEWRTWAAHVAGTVDWEEASAAVVAELRYWPPLQNADRTLTFFAMAHEIDLAALRETGPTTQFLATRTPESGGDLSIHSLDGPLEVHRFGFLQPHASAPEYRPDDVTVFLVPGVAFDLYGNRLGRGAGYYDRLLAQTRPGAFTVGITSTRLVVDRLPTEVHDRKVRYLATEEGVIETAHG
jgi:5-formyltetrahydrofolate cyclo-ligase